MRKTNANLFSTRFDRPFLGDEMIDNAKISIVVAVAKRVLIPVVVGGIVGWLMAHGYSDWADAVCSSSRALGISVTECE
jgi:hypothetical protein